MSSHQKRPHSKTRNNKKDGESEGTEMPRPLSRQGSSLKLTINKLKKDELVRLNSDLQKQVSASITENQQLREKLKVVADIIVENARLKGLRMGSSMKDTLDIPAEQLVTWLNEMLKEEDQGENTMESRVEELETRITHLSLEFAKLVQLRLEIENGLEDIENTECLEDAHRQARTLLYETKGSRLFTCLADKNSAHDRKVFGNSDDRDEENSQSTQNSEQQRKVPILPSMEKLDFTPPAKKMPGNTHIHEIQKGLREYLIRELSKYKGNGADWRVLGERVGIPNDTIKQWHRWKVELPMQYVMETWGRSPGATVRLLHRHLVSPQLRYIILAKICSDFYEVD